MSSKYQDNLWLGKELRKQFWDWIKKQRQNSVIAEFHTVSWDGLPCLYKMHSKGYVEILCKRPYDQFYQIR